MSLVIYCYYEKDQTYKNNLIFFLRRGLLPSVDYLFVINGQSTVEIPNAPNIRIISRENIGFDFGAYKDAIIQLGDDYKKYKYFFFMNTSIRGPFMAPCDEANWTVPFIEKLRGDTHLVGTTINILMYYPNHPYIQDIISAEFGLSSPYPHVQTQMFALSAIGFEYLRENFFLSRSIETDFMRCIALCEVYMSQLIIREAGWNIDCLIPEYSGLDYRTIKRDINASSNYGDPCYPGTCFGRTLHPYEVIFIKTNRGLNDHAINSLSLSILNEA
jgi:Rhamnan synthesis protein F